MRHPIFYRLSATVLGLLFASTLSGSGSASLPTSKGQTSNPATPQQTSPLPAEARAPVPQTVHVTVDVLGGRHAISPYVYGGAYPKDAATITDSGISVVRWGGNATSRSNWKAGTYNAANDW